MSFHYWQQGKRLAEKRFLCGPATLGFDLLSSIEFSDGPAS
jgi:hypothetical protein